MSIPYARHQKSGKANFDDIYDREDPREYFGSLGELGYEIPEHGRRLFSALIEERRDDGERVNVVDVCCSYGVNAALLKHETTLDDLYDRYGSEEISRLSSEELAEADAAFYAQRRRKDPPRIVGLDSASNAVSYALRAGLLDAGFAENLEEGGPAEELGQAVSRADLLTVTGGIGYVSERTFDRLLGCMSQEERSAPPWVAVLALRWVSYDAISDVLSKHGLVTEKLATHTFGQRRFASLEEREYVLGELKKMGIDPEGKESEGLYHADFYLSRPADLVSRTPVEELVAAAL